MATEQQQNFPRFASFTTEKTETFKWIKSNINCKEGKKTKPPSFLNDLSFYGCRLFPWQHMSDEFQRLYKEAILDGDMKEDLEDCGALNWSVQFVKLEPIAVTRDGNGLLHAVSVGMWSVEDTSSTLKELLLLAMCKNKNNSFKSRWWRQKLIDLNTLKNHAELVDKEWEDVLNSMSFEGSTCRSHPAPHTLLESIHLYVLANILRRPLVIVADSVARSVTGDSLQDNHIAGIYLPLEWPPIKCGKSPLILGFSHGHFCPLVSVDGQNSANGSMLFPLVGKDFSSLPVRFLTEQEEATASELIQKYFHIREVSIPLQNSLPLPCAVLKPCPLPAQHDHVQQHFELCQQVALTFSSMFHQTVPNPDNDPNFLQRVHQNSQTRVVPMRSFSDAYNAFTNKTNTTLTVEALRSQHHDSEMTLPNLRVSELESRRTAKEMPMCNDVSRRGRKCILSECNGNGVSTQGYLCNNCFKNYTIAEAGGQLISVENEDFRKTYTLRETTGTMNDQSALSLSDLDKAERPAVGLGASNVASLTLSMMEERCRTGCGYRCSKFNYPYCHECAPGTRNLPTGSTLVTGNNNSIKNIRDPENDLMVFSPTNSFNRTNNNVSRIANSSTSDHTRAVSNTRSLTTSRTCDLDQTSPTQTQGPPLTIQDLLNQTNTSPAGVIQQSKNGEVGEHNHLQASGHKQSLERQTEHETVMVRPVLSTQTAMAEAPVWLIGSGETADVSRERSCPATPVKCASPYCSLSVQPPAKLCVSCENVLRQVHRQRSSGDGEGESSSKRHQSKSQMKHDQASTGLLEEASNLTTTGKVVSPSKTKRTHTIAQQGQTNAPQPEERRRGQPCIMNGCTKFGDPAQAYMCSECYRLSIVNYEKLQRQFRQNKQRTTPMTAEPHRQVEQNGETSSSSFPYISNSIPTSHHYNSISHRPAPLVESSLLSTIGSTGRNLPSLSLDDLSSQHGRFTLEYDRIQAKTKAGAKVCIMVNCNNFGNPNKGGFCNACCAVRKEFEVSERIAKYGENVPDCAESRQHSI